MTQEEMIAHLEVLKDSVRGLMLEMTELQAQIREGLPPDSKVAERYRS